MDHSRVAFAHFNLVGHTRLTIVAPCCIYALFHTTDQIFRRSPQIKVIYYNGERWESVYELNGQRASEYIVAEEMIGLVVRISTDCCTITRNERACYACECSFKKECDIEIWRVESILFEWILGNVSVVVYSPATMSASSVALLHFYVRFFP